MFAKVALVSILWLAGQSLVIDVTEVVPRGRLREPTTASASGGGVGYGDGTTQRNELPLTLRIISVQESVQSSERYLTFEVGLTNVGKNKFVIPIDPHLADLEPAKAATPYAFSDLYLSPIVEIGSKRCTLQGVSLYGATNMSGTIQELFPDESIAIRARTRLTTACQVGETDILAGQKQASLKVSLLLTKKYVELRGAQLHEDSRQAMPQVESSNILYFSVLN